jgi:hypothetical protein
VLDRRRAALELEFEAELAAGVYSLSNGERREGPQLTFPPPPPAAPPRDVWEADAWVPVLSRRGAPHASRLAEAELEAQLTRLVLSLMVASPGGDDAPARRGGQGLQTAARRRSSCRVRPGHPPQQAQPPDVGCRVAL